MKVLNLIVKQLQPLFKFVPVEQFKRFIVICSFIAITAIASAALLSVFAYKSFQTQTADQSEQIKRYAESQTSLKVEEELKEKSN